MGPPHSVQQLIQGTPTFTPTITLTPSPSPTATTTLTPTRTPTPTATPNLTATQQYESFIGFVQRAFEEGQITTTEGKYRKLDDFSGEVAMTYGFRWKSTGVNTKDFIIRAEFDWEVANEINNSGCGYIFRQSQEEYYALIALDARRGTLLAYTKTVNDMFGNFSVIHARIDPIKKTQLPKMGQNPYHAIFTLIVNEKNVYTYVNDEFFTEYRLSKDFPSTVGDLSSMVLTGSINDFGTRCKITNSELWIIEQ